MTPDTCAPRKGGWLLEISSRQMESWSWSLLNTALTRIICCSVWPVLREGNVWKRILPIAETLITLLPKTANFLLLRSQALHELGRTEEAYEALFSVVESFKTNQQVHYDLARYAAHLGRLEIARSHFEAAFELSNDAEKLKLLTKDDPALNALWAEPA